jgi:hypothetical protein
MLPLLFYSFVAVISGHNVTASPRWPLVWVHFRMTFLAILHATLWAWNIYVFKTFKINYCLIFDINPGSQLHFNALLKLCAAAALWTLIWLTVSLQKIVSESSSLSDLSHYAWANALEQYDRAPCYAAPLCMLCISLCACLSLRVFFSGSSERACRGAQPGRLVVLSFIVLLFLPLPVLAFGTRRCGLLPSVTVLILLLKPKPSFVGCMLCCILPLSRTDIGRAQRHRALRSHPTQHEATQVLDTRVVQDVFGSSARSHVAHVLPGRPALQPCAPHQRPFGFLLR